MGCGSSWKILSSVSTSNTSRDQLSPKPSPRKSIELTQIRLENFEPFTLVCLADDDRTGFHDHDKQLRSVIDYVRCFDQLEECEQFILNHHYCEYIFFIVSSRHATNIISHIHDLSHVLAVYILQQNSSQGNQHDIIDGKWTKRYSKVKGIYFDRDVLIDELTNDVKIYTNIGDLLPITVYSRSDIPQNGDTSIDHLRFVFYQLFLHNYCQKSPTLDKSHLLEVIEDYYRCNPDELNQINEYRSTKKLLTYFLRKSFLRRLLTKALLTLNFRILSALRFFIKDMYKIMLEKSRASREKTYYRSQILSKETFEKIKTNIGELLSINNFLFVTENRHDSLTLLRENVAATKSLNRVLFEIHVPKGYACHEQHPFIDIENFTVDEHVVLFFIGSIFRINAVDFDMNNDCWIIQLTIYDERNNEDFSHLFTYLHASKNDSPITLANLLRQISPTSAQLFYKHLLKDTAEPSSKLECYRGLGLCSYSQEDYAQALNYFEKALEMKPTDQFSKSSLHNSIGLVYAQQDNHDQASLHFTEALENSSSALNIACVHHNLALISSRQGLLDNELEHYEEAFQIRTDQLPSDHLQIASLLNNIGVAHSDMRQYDQALSNLKKSLQMKLKLLSDSHIDVARSYANIGNVYAKTEEYPLALEYLNKAQLLFEIQSAPPEQEMKQIDRNIKIVNNKLRRKTF